MIEFIIWFIVSFLIGYFFIDTYIFHKDINELSRLNKIWDEFNKGQDLDIIAQKIEKGNWRYHNEKVNLLIDLVNLKYNAKNKSKI